MKTLTEEMQCRIRRWIERNARPLEWALYRQKFENGSESAVLEALSAYQNPDGGFGYALEPDDWNQNSTLNATLYAMQLMLNIGVTQHPLMEGALRFLRSEACFRNGEWQFCTPSSRDYPHAPWWGMTEDEAKEENAGVSNKVAGLILTILSAGRQPLSDSPRGSQAQLSAIHAGTAKGRKWRCRICTAASALDPAWYCTRTRKGRQADAGDRQCCD